MFIGCIIYKGAKKIMFLLNFAVKMYVAKPLSGYLKNPGSLSLPPDGPNSGFLVLQDEEAETYSCLGCKSSSLKHLPFPQNKDLILRDADASEGVILIPVLNLPLSCNRYYAIYTWGKNHNGLAFTCSREKDKRTLIFNSEIKDTKLKPFDPRNVYQQFEICANEPHVRNGIFHAKSVAPDGHLPLFLKNKRWWAHTEPPMNYELREAPGLNAPLRAHQPGLNFPPSYRSSKAVVVGKWYTPFMFVKEGKVREQVKTSPFYEVTLEQKWERIFSSQNDDSHKGRCVNFNVMVDAEMVHVDGKKAVWDEKNVTENAIWFWSEEARVLGLGVELVQRMKWEQERGGWRSCGKEKQESVKRSEKFEGNGVWREFGCYVLVESFVFKRMDGNVVLKYDFKHTQHIRSIWNQ